MTSSVCVKFTVKMLGQRKRQVACFCVLQGETCERAVHTSSFLRLADTWSWPFMLPPSNSVFKVPVSSLALWPSSSSSSSRSEPQGVRLLNIHENLIGSRKLTAAACTLGRNWTWELPRKFRFFFNLFILLRWLKQAVNKVSSATRHGKKNLQKKTKKCCSCWKLMQFEY